MTTSAPLTVPAKKVLSDGALERLLMRVEAALDALEVPLNAQAAALDAAAHLGLISADYRLDHVEHRRLNEVVDALRFCLAAAVLQQETEWIDRWLTLWMRIDISYTEDPTDEDAKLLTCWLKMLPRMPEQVQARLCGAASRTLRVIAARTLRAEEPEQQARLRALWRAPEAGVWVEAHSALVKAGVVPAWMGPLPNPLPAHIRAEDVGAEAQAALARLNAHAQRPLDFLNTKDFKALEEGLAALPAALAVEAALTFLSDYSVLQNDELCNHLLSIVNQRAEGGALLCAVLLLRVVEGGDAVGAWLRALQTAAACVSEGTRAAFCEAFDRLCVPTLKGSRWWGAWSWRQAQRVEPLFALAKALWIPSAPCHSLFRDVCALPAETKKEVKQRNALINQALTILAVVSPEGRDIEAVLAYTAQAMTEAGPRHHWGLLKHVIEVLPEASRHDALDGLWRGEGLSEEGRRHLFSEWVFERAPGTVAERFERFLADPSTRPLMLSPFATRSAETSDLQRAAALRLPPVEGGALLQRILWFKGVLFRFGNIGLAILTRVEDLWEKRKTSAWWERLWRGQATPEEVQAVRCFRDSLDRDAPDFWARALEMVPAPHQDPSDAALLDEALAVWRADPARVPTTALVAVLLGMRGIQGIEAEIDLIWERALLCQEHDDTQTLLKVCFLVCPERMLARHLPDVKRPSTPPHWLLSANSDG